MVDLRSELRAARQQAREAIEQQAAVSDVLKAMSRSPYTLDEVLQATIDHGTTLCQAENGLIYLLSGDELRLRTDSHASPESTAYELAHPTPIDRGSAVGRAVVERNTVHITDVLADPEYRWLETQKLVGYRTLLAVPIRRANEILGVIAFSRGAVLPFSERDIALVETFADQAAIAIENVRLFNETKEALERQTATSELLGAMSQSAFDLKPVFEMVLDKSLALCHAQYGWIHEFTDHDQTLHNVAAKMSETMASIGGGGRERWRPSDASLVGRVCRERRTLHVADITADPTVAESTAIISNGARTALGVPLLRGDQLLGAIIIVRIEVRPFEPREIELVESFADQAAIAIENVRLFNETKESLERQTAIGDILRVISASPADIQPVLDAIAESAARFCVAENVSVIMRGEDGLLHVRAHVGPLSTNVPPWVVDRTTVTGRSIVEARTIQVPDLQTAGDEYPLGQAQALVLDERTTMAAPLLRDGRGIGALFLRRAEVRPFSDKQVELVKVFADQAVIAIENVRLINEIQAKSAQLEGANRELAAASRHKSEFLANMSHELRTPLNAIIGFSDVLEQRLFGELNERQVDYTRDIASSGRHLLDLVNEILDLSKVEAGRMELEPSEFALAETIRGAVAFVRERAAAHGIALGADLPDDLGTVVADERKVRQVLLNLLSNAVKFTPDSGAISVRAWRSDSEVEVSVRDTGIGIAPEDQAKVFDEFQQVGKPSDRSREGTGLGLTLAKRFIELHGGRIWIESEIGTGTTFTFAIPVRSDSATPA